MSYTPFKMKGWSGNQSPIKQKTSFADIQENISNTLSKIRPKTIEYDKTTKKSTSGLGLTVDEKKAAKKAGMSEWQWKTSKSKSGTRANKWVKREGDDNSYKMTDDAVVVKNKDGKEITDSNPKSRNFKSISEIINNIFNKSEGETTPVVENIPTTADITESSSGWNDIGNFENLNVTDFLLEEQSSGHISKKNVKLIKSDPLAYLNKELKQWNELLQMPDEESDDYYEENVERLERLINELKNKKKK